MPITPVSSLTKFLGSGNTTLLGRAPADASLSNTLVIVNEFGEAAINDLIVPDLTECGSLQPIRVRR